MPTFQNREEKRSRMSITDKNMTPKKMREKLAELDYSQNQLKSQNNEMRHLLDVADEEMTALRSENAALKKKVKDLEKSLTDVQQVEAERCTSLPNDADVSFKVKIIQKLEQESSTLKEENKKLTAEVLNLQEQREQDKINLSKLSVALNTLQVGMEEVQLGLQQREETIEQKNVQLKRAEEAVEECSVVIKDLRQTNQDLRNQIEDRQDEASFAALRDMIGEKEGSHGPPLSFAEEIKLLTSSTSVGTDQQHAETEAEKPPAVKHVSVNLQTSRCAAAMETVVHKAGVFLLFIFTTALLAFVALRSYTEHPDMFSINSLWSSTCLLYPYISVHHVALPPI